MKASWGATQSHFKTTLAPKVAPWVTAVAVRREKQLAVNFVAWHPTMPVRVALTLAGAKAAGEAKVMTVSGPTPNALNDDGKPAVVTLAESALRLGPPTVVTLPAASVTTVLVPLE